MKVENRFYVYLHVYASGEKSGKPFYIGKGTGRRAYSNSSRNNHWHSVNNKYGKVVVFYEKNLLEHEACLLEAKLITEIGISNLTNKSVGGDKGALGFRHSEDWKIQMSKMMSAEMKKRMQSPDYVHPCAGRLMSDESKKLISSSLKEARKNMSDKKKKLIASNISNSLRKQESVEKRKLINSGENNPMYDKRVFLFKHKSGDIFEGTQFQLSVEKSINKGNISSMVCGKRKSVSGWRIENHVIS
jgi:hypothetical protein